MNFCSHCGAAVEWSVPADDDRPRYVCPTCHQIHYQNPKMVVGTVPEWEDKILLCRRRIAPQIGKWTLPAGYLENGETVADGARRETSEETGADIGELTPYCLFDIAHINQIYLMFRSPLIRPAFTPTRESSEIRLFSKSEIPMADIAFRVIEATLRHYFYDRSQGNFPFRIDQILPPDAG